MQPYQERVVAERDELTDKIVKLLAFIHTPARWVNLDSAERARLERQLVCMRAYRAILDERIAEFKD